MHRDVEMLARTFRKAIEETKAQQLFAKDYWLRDFPKRSCGATSRLLAYYLYKNNIETVYVCGKCGDQTHAWLVMKDEKVTVPQIKHIVFPEDIRRLINFYGGDCSAESKRITNFEAENVENGIIIDITADQFDEMEDYPVFVGPMNSFYRKFKFDFARDYVELSDDELENYNLIMREMRW